VGSETEVKVIDPNQLEVIEAVGCRIREAYILRWTLVTAYVPSLTR
jgi:hypothetical protein